MKTVSVREVQHQLAAILDRVERGEEVTVTRRGRPVARIVPPRPPKKVHWPDFAARMRRDFPQGVPPGPPVSELIDADREERP
jgi:prevent-host-death family protein